ncbi:MAG: EpsD family peptidyl-prolyl cis-trans isomerase [Rubrivivax sp.]
MQEHTKMTRVVRTSTRNLRTAALATALVSVLLVGCGDKKKEAGASQTAVKVNKEEITVHQINYQLQQQRGLRPEQADAASKQILERLIDQELALQKANEMKLDRDPRVMQQLEAAKREVIARAYLERAGEGVPKPSPEDISKYYEDHPALFKDRRVYSLQEIAIEATPEQVPALKTRLEASKNVGEFVEYLKANDFRFGANQAVRAAEQLPLASLPTFAKLKDGQALLNVTATGAQVIVLAGSRAQAVTPEQAKPAIEQFIINERKRDIIAKDLKAMRDAATIQYVGKYGEAASAPPASTAAAVETAAPAVVASPMTTPTPTAPAASGLDASSISKGMGLK